MSNVFDACPSCGTHFLYSSVLKEPAEKIELYCRYCKSNYELDNTREQQQRLKNVYGEPSQINQLLVIDQLSKGDVIVFQRTARVLKYQHHVVVTDVDQYSGKVTVVEFQKDLPIRKGSVVIEEKDFETKIKNENAWIRLYMPLDCLPVDEVLTKANRYIHNPDSQPGYDLSRFNCQHLSSWCKTGKLKSKEATNARWFYHLAFHGIQIFSLFMTPPIVIGALIYTSADTIVRVGRIWRTEYDLMEKEMKTKWQAVGPDILSMIATFLYLGAAAAVLGQRLK